MVNTMVKIIKNRFYFNKYSAIFFKRLSLLNIEVNNCDFYNNDDHSIIINKVKHKSYE